MAILFRRSVGNREHTTRRALLRYCMGGVALALALVACANSAFPGQPRAGGGSSAPTSSAPVPATTTFGSPPISASPSSPSTAGSAQPATTGATNTQGPGDSQPTVTPAPSNGTVILTNADAATLDYYAVPVGTVIEVHFDAFTPPPATILDTNAIDNSILRTLNTSGDRTRHSQAVFRAVAVGKTGIVASEYGACTGRCENVGLSLFIDVIQ